jgi:hypothetical protein
MSKFELDVWVSQEFPKGWTHVIKGSFADPQLATQAAADVFCYDQNTGIGAFFATVKNGILDDGTPVPDGLRKVGGNHTFDRRWTHIVHFMDTVLVTGPFGGTETRPICVLLFYDAVSGVGQFYHLDKDTNLVLLKQYSRWSTSWTQIIAGHFGKANLLFYAAASRTGKFYTVSFSADYSPEKLDIKTKMRLIRSYTNWDNSWHLIISGNFSSSPIDDLLFYSKTAGVGKFYKLDGNGGMTLLKKYEGWRKTWQHIVSGQFLQNSNFDGLLFFEEGSVTTKFYATNGLGDMARIDVDPGTQWRLPWQAILAGNFVPNLGVIGNSSLFTYHSDGAIRYFFFQPATI